MLILMFLGTLIGFVEKKKQSRVVTSVDISVVNSEESFFLTESNIEAIVTHNGRYPMDSVLVDNMDMKSIENRLEKNKFVESAQVYRDLKGNLNIAVRQNVATARFFLNDTSFYLGSKGNLLPQSNRYTARVTLVSGKGLKHYINLGGTSAEEVDSTFNEMIQKIYRDEFLKRQIAQIDVKKNGDIMLYMQMSKQVVEFGKPKGFEDKFSNLKIFYNKLLPSEGYGKYDKVSVKFKDQIVCE